MLFLIGHHGGIIVVKIETSTPVGPGFEFRPEGDFFLGTQRSSPLNAFNVDSTCLLTLEQQYLEKLPRGKRLA